MPLPSLSFTVPLIVPYSAAARVIVIGYSAVVSPSSAVTTIVFSSVSPVKSSSKPLSGISLSSIVTVALVAWATGNIVTLFETYAADAVYAPLFSSASVPFTATEASVASSWSYGSPSYTRK